MRTHKMSLQVTAYHDGTYSVAVIKQTWDRNAWRHEQPVFKRWATRKDLHDHVHELLSWIIGYEEAATDMARRSEGR